MKTPQEMVVEQQAKCKHQTLSFTSGGQFIQCGICGMRYAAVNAAGYPANYYNIYILSTDSRVDPYLPNPPVH